MPYPSLTPPPPSPSLPSLPVALNCPEYVSISSFTVVSTTRKVLSIAITARDDDDDDDDADDEDADAEDEDDDT